MKRLSAMVLVSGLAACGGEETTFDDVGTEESAITVLTLSGKVQSLDGVEKGAVVQAFDANGVRLGRTVTSATGAYTLALSENPSRVLVTQANRAPLAFPSPKLTVSLRKARLDADLGPWLGSDFIAENVTYQVTRGLSQKLVRTVAWGFGGGLGAPWDEAADVLHGPRLPQLQTLVPSGTRLVPNVEAAITRDRSTRGDYLTARFSAELNGYNLGAAGTGDLIGQIVQTISRSVTGNLPVRILVACGTCSGGYAPLRDGHVGGTGPNGSYAPGTAPAVPADVAKHRAKAHVVMASDLGWIPVATSFKPDAPATRAFVAQLLVKALNLTSSPTAARFRDVPTTHAAYRAIDAAVAAGAMSAAADGLFHPEDPVTRATFAGFVVTAAKWPAFAAPAPTFTDVPTTYWAFSRIETAYAWCRAVDLRSPTATDFLPAATTTRAEAVMGVVRMANCFIGAGIKGN